VKVLNVSHNKLRDDRMIYWQNNTKIRQHSCIFRKEDVKIHLAAGSVAKINTCNELIYDNFCLDHEDVTKYKTCHEFNIPELRRND